MRTIIAAKRGRSDEPLVTVTAPKSAAQVRVAFNAALVKQVHLDGSSHLALVHDDVRRTLRFVPSGPSFEDVHAHKILFDGGKKTASRMVLVARPALSFLPRRAYAPKALKDGAFEIAYGEGS
jgi:hypothetical protein